MDYDYDLTELKEYVSSKRFEFIMFIGFLLFAILFTSVIILEDIYELKTLEIIFLLGTFFIIGSLMIIVNLKPNYSNYVSSYKKYVHRQQSKAKANKIKDTELEKLLK